MSQPGCSGINANADVSGKGVRINFYYTMVLLAIVPRTPYTEELLNALYANAGLSGLGLLLTAIVQTAQHQLSLFHALFIQHILFFLGTGAAPMGKYHWSRSRIVMGVVVQYASVIAFAAWSIYLWAHVGTFGAQHQCNDEVKYVVMFVSVRTTVSWLRGVWIAVLVAATLSLMAGFAITALFVLKMRDEEVGGEGGGEGGEQPEQHKPWYFNVSFALLLSAIYSTVMLELTVQRNSKAHGGIVDADDNEWAFGQILSIVMIIANLNEVIHCLFGLFSRRRRDRAERAEVDEAPRGADNPPAIFQARGPAVSSGLVARRSAVARQESQHELLDVNTGSRLDVRKTSDADLSSTSDVHDQPIGTLR
ncbi:hypothetical protein BC834DRAFT_1039527 [Gloeopeniophorella convolvens]|nr:hypothetical protein BC834DRAFT_1039527 [Gloeopeniophorella convolvens]